MVGILEISTVVGCSMKCNYCPQKLHTQSYQSKERMMSMETFSICFNKLPDNLQIQFAGMAEPWINPNATEMLLMAQDHPIQVYTTCYGMTLEDVEKIKHIPFIHFCLHLPDEDGIMKINITDEYLKVVHACLSLNNVNKMCVGNLHSRVKDVTGNVPDSNNSLISRAGKLIPIEKKKGHLYCSSMPHKLDHNILLPNGDVLLCCMDYGNEHIIGNLLEMEYDELFKSEEYKRIEEGLKDDDSNILCRTCEISKQW